MPLPPIRKHNVALVIKTKTDHQHDQIPNLEEFKMNISLDKTIYAHQTSLDGEHSLTYHTKLETILKRLRMLLITVLFVLLFSSCKTYTPCQLPKESQVFIDGLHAPIKIGGVIYGLTRVNISSEYRGGMSGSTISTSFYKPKDPQQRFAILVIQMPMLSTNHSYNLMGITLNNGMTQVHPSIQYHYLTDERHTSMFTFDSDLCIFSERPGLYTIQLGYVYTPPTRFDSISISGVVSENIEAIKINAFNFKVDYNKQSKNQRIIPLNSNDSQIDGYQYFKHPDTWGTNINSSVPQ